MFKRLGVPVLALASVLAVAAPATSMARDWDDHHGRFEHREVFRGYDHDRGFRFGFGVNVAPAPVVAPANGYYDQFGVWHPYGFYDRFGVYHAY